MAVIFFEGSVTEPRRTFVTDLVTDLRNKTRWLVTHLRYIPLGWLHAPRYIPQSMHRLSVISHGWAPADQTSAEHAIAEESTCRELAIPMKS